MKDFCENQYCESPGAKVVPVSVKQPSDQKRTLCVPCEEAYTWGVQHGTISAQAAQARPHVDRFLKKDSFVIVVRNDGDPKELEESLSELNQKVLDAHTSFDAVKARLKKTTQLVPLGTGEPVHIEALPGKVFDLLSRTQVMLSCRSGAKLPLNRHGEGTQSLAVMFLFDAFLESRLTDEYDKDASPILALEEPEAHLHPSAIRSLAVLLQELKGQKLVSTHSGDLLAGIPLTAVRRLARENGVIKLHRLKDNTLSDEELDKVTYHIRSQRGQLLFARCWLLVEGQSEYWLLPECARQMGTAFDQRGVCCVEYRQFDIDPLLRLADDMGIAWHVLTDSDSQGQTDAGKVRSRLAGRAEADHLTTLAERDVEHALWAHGYAPTYEAVVTPDRRAQIVLAQPGTPDYVSQVIKAAVRSTSKPFLATAVCGEAAKAGSPGVPPLIRQAIVKAIELAERAQ